MYLRISYDGQIIGTSGEPYLEVGNNVYLDREGGLLLYISESGSPHYDGSKIDRIGITYISYGGYNDWYFERDKLKKIGNAYLSYNDANTSYSEGKIREIANVSIYYNGYQERSEIVGKPYKIGSARIYYDSYGGISKISK